MVGGISRSTLSWQLKHGRKLKDSQISDEVDLLTEKAIALAADVNKLRSVEAQNAILRRRLVEIRTAMSKE